MENVLEQKGLGQLEQQKIENERAAGIREGKRDDQAQPEDNQPDTVAKDKEAGGNFKSALNQAKKNTERTIKSRDKFAKKFGKRAQAQALKLGAKIGLKGVYLAMSATLVLIVATAAGLFFQVFVGDMMGNERFKTDALDKAIFYGSLFILTIVTLLTLTILIILVYTATDPSFAIEFWGAEIF